MTKGGTNSGWPVDNPVAWRMAGQLLKAGQYERVAEILHDMEVGHERAGDAILAHALAVACRICLACRQCRDEVEWHWQAGEEADQREHELKQQLYTILDLINGHQSPDKREELATASTGNSSPHGRAAPKSVARPSLWQRVQRLLGRRWLSWFLERDSSIAFVAGWPRPATEKAKPLTASLPVPAREEVSTSLAEKEEQAKQTSPSLVVYCLGLFRVYGNEQRIEKWPGCKCKSILKYMVIHRERPVHREILMDLFWRDVDPEAARRNLYQAIYSLRQALQTGDPDFPFILCEDSCYHLNPDLELWVDSEAFCLHYQTGQRLEREGRLHEAIRAYELAENLYEGEFLAEDRYEDWTLVHRENLKHKHLDILDRLSQHYFDQAQFATCIAFCHKILVGDSCREDAHRRLIRCYLRQGQRHLALRQYHLCVEALERELDVPPMPATTELYQQIQTNLIQL